MSTLFMMVGIPGSGKSYYIKNYVNQNENRIVSRDVIRYSLLSDEDEYFSKEKEVFETFIKEIQTGLDTEHTVYADATHLNSNSRYKLLHNLDLSNTDVIPIFFGGVPLQLCLERNATRTGRAYVPEDVIKKMYMSLTDPTFDDFIEYKYIIHVTEGNNR